MSALWFTYTEQNQKQNPQNQQQNSNNNKSKQKMPPSLSKCNEFEPNIYNIWEYIYQSNKAVVPPKFCFFLGLVFEDQGNGVI